MKKQWTSSLSLFTSFSTLICCALPALFVSLGMGATLASFVGAFPQVVWFSENKGFVFGIAGVLLLVAGWFRYQARNRACPIDPDLAEACKNTKDWSKWVYWISVGLYLTGVFFAFIAPVIF